jgi:hypothetical protein
LTVPIQGVLGRIRFVQKSLDTENRRMAERRAAVLKIKWLSEIETARKGTVDHVEKDALFWRKVLQESYEVEPDVVLDFIADEAR